jgi:hypothetical protein
MISTAVLLSPTRIIGLAAYAFALISCAIAWVKGRRSQHRRRLTMILTTLEAALLLDSVFNGRWLLHNSLAHLAMANHLYGKRSGPQHVALDLLASAVAVGVGVVLWLFRDRPGAFLAVTAGILSLSCWWVEVISLHAVDGLLYQRVDGIMLVRLAWSACSVMMGVGMLWDTFGGHAHVLPDEYPADALIQP